MDRFVRVHFFFWSRCCYCCCLLLPTTSVLRRCFSAISPPQGLVSSRGLRAAIALSHEGLARVRIRPRRGRRAALARWQGRVSAVSHKRPNHSPVSFKRPVCGICTWYVLLLYSPPPAGCLMFFPTRTLTAALTTKCPIFGLSSEPK